jgi:four helix bundle protein
MEKGLEGLAVWQKSIDLAKVIHQQVLPRLPEVEKWALASQLRRSSQSIAANIAEGYGRYYYQEGVRFCYIARGSLDETSSHLYFAKEVGYLDEKILSELDQNIAEIRKMISGYIAYLKKSKKGANEPGANLREPSASYMIEDDPYPDS